jgi:hypothetical protein
MKIEAHELRTAGCVAYIAATDAEADALTAKLDAYIAEYCALPFKVIIGRVQFCLTWHPIAHPRKSSGTAAVGRPKGRASEIEASASVSRSTFYRAQRNVADEEAAKAGAEWVAPPLSARRSLRGDWPARRRIPAGILSQAETKSLSPRRSL